VPELTVANRRRIKLAVTVHPSTIDKLASLCDRFKMPSGRVIDRMVEILAGAYALGKMSCVTGGVCPMSRTDLPEVL